MSFFFFGKLFFFFAFRREFYSSNDVTHLDVRDGRKTFLRVGVLRVEREEGSDSERHPRRNGFRADPKRDPAHDDDEAGRNISVEQVVAEPAPERQHHLEASEISCESKTRHSSIPSVRTLFSFRRRTRKSF